MLAEALGLGQGMLQDAQRPGLLTAGSQAEMCFILMLHGLDEGEAGARSTAERSAGPHRGRLRCGCCAKPGSPSAATWIAIYSMKRTPSKAEILSLRCRATSAEPTNSSR